jgi:hypothetical protein
MMPSRIYPDGKFIAKTAIDELFKEASFLCERETKQSSPFDTLKCKKQGRCIILFREERIYFPFFTFVKIKRKHKAAIIYVPDFAINCMTDVPEVLSIKAFCFEENLENKIISLIERYSISPVFGNPELHRRNYL